VSTVGCQLLLTFAPPALSSGSLPLNYSYTDDAGTVKTGSVNIAYAATPPPHLYVAQFSLFTPFTGSLQSCALNNDGTLASCAATGNAFANPTGIAFYGANLAYVADYDNGVFLCSVAADGTLSGCLNSGSNFQNPWQLAVQGTTLYATNASGSGGITTCAIGADGTLSGCSQSTGGTGTAGIAVSASSAYIGVAAGTVNVCAVGTAGALSGCTPTGSGFSSLDGISLAGGFAYVANEGAGSVSVCTINAVDGTLSACAASTVLGGNPTDVAFDGTRAYVADFVSGHMTLCAVAATGALVNCAVSDGGTAFAAPANQIAIH
jgi:hypothetical protein